MDCKFPLHTEFKTNYLQECSGLDLLEFNSLLLTSVDNSILPNNLQWVYRCYFQNNIYLVYKQHSLSDFYPYC
jgi:hypothetical protein